MSNGAWQRFLDQKTAPQRLLIAVAGIVAALVTIGGGVYAASTLLGGDGGANDGSVVAGERIEQGTDAADAFVKRLLTADGERLKLKREVAASDGEAPFDSGDIRLHYNCKGRPVGDDSCNVVRLQLANDKPQPQIVDKVAGFYNGTYAITVDPPGAAYASDFDVVLDDVAK